MSRLNIPIWKDADIHQTGYTLQHLVNGSWQNTGMKIMPVPSGYTPDAAINRYVENDLKSTAPNLNYSGTTGITPQPYAYQIYKISGATLEYGFLNDWSYEDWSGTTRCISAPINRHADSRQKLVYGNFAETGNSIVVKEMIIPEILMNPNIITLNAETDRPVTAIITSNIDFDLILPLWLTASQTAFTSGTTQFYIYPQTNTSFDSRQFTIQAKHEGYWSPDYEYTNLAYVAQSGKVAYLTITPDPVGISYSAGSCYVTVYTNTDFTATTNSSDTWLTYSGKTEVGVNYYNVYFNVSANTGDNRQTHAYFEYVVNSTGGTRTRALRFVQAHAPNISLDSYSKDVSAAGEDIRIAVTSEAPWTATTQDSWLQVWPWTTGDTGTSVVFMNISANSGLTPRSGEVVFSNGVKQAVLSVSQKAASANNMIVYTNTVHDEFNPYQTGSTYYGANIVSNTYYPDDDYGVILFDDDVTLIGYRAFYKKPYFKSIILPNSVTSIGNQAFEGCADLTNVSLGSGVTTIGSSAFSGCTSLSAITIPEGVTTIGQWAFRRCAISSITISENVTSIEKGAFEGCWGLSSITVSRNNAVYNDGNGSNCIIKTDNNTLIAGCKTTVIPNSVVIIEEGACSYTSLLNVTIPNSVITIGKEAFEFCTSLSSVTIGNGVTSFGKSAFYYCISLLNVEINNGATLIGESAFSNCTNLTSVTIPDSVTTIGYEAFRYCTNLPSVTIGSGVTMIGGSAFYGCSKLLSIIYNGTMAQWNSITKGTNWHYNVPATRVNCTDGDVPI